jgi:5-methylcytosine-specific restriction protein A|tara:strand:- start:2278 stop:2880 length:603 start_codon:yes stop_codon:yes gene_type:complete
MLEYGKNETPWDLTPLLYSGGAAAKVKTVRREITSGSLGGPSVERQDKHGNVRKVVVFNLVPVGLELERPELVEDDDESDPNLSLAQLRERALAAAASSGPGSKSEALRTNYRRSKRISDYVLKRADGKCESCKKPAPFIKKNGSPYLEPHHVNRLSDGGLDHPRYIGAVCPDCHREIHHGIQGHVKNDRLKAYVAALEQ